MLEIRDDRQLRSITGMSEEKLAEVEQRFTEVYSYHQEMAYEEAKASGKRQRKLGGGRKSHLLTMRDKVVFILHYFKVYPTFDVLGTTFGLSRSKAHEQVQKLTPVMEETLASLGYLPKREIEDVEELQAMCADVDKLLIDVTERECQRPKDEKKQKEHYSGKKKYHTVQNTIMSSREKVILFVGKTFSGHHHDYAMLKEEFPTDKQWFEGIDVSVDLGYQGIKTDYQAPHIEIPHKKPRKSKVNPNPELTQEQKAYNKMVGKTRIYVENAIGGMKRFGILSQCFRNRLHTFADKVVAICAGLWNALIS